MYVMQCEDTGVEINHEELAVSLASDLLAAWLDLNRCAHPCEVGRVLVRHGVAASGPLRDALDGLLRGLRLIAMDPPLLVCLEGTPGELDLFSTGAAYVADPNNAARNLLAELGEAELGALREAARSQITTLVLLER